LRLSLSNASSVVRLAKATTTMFQLASGILGAAAATLALGTVHLEVSANGGRVQQQGQQTAIARSDAVSQVERAGKGDRLTAPSAQGQNLTVSFGLPGADSSVMMRVLLPASDQNAAKQKAPAPADRASTGKRMVACEPSVSVLTPVAKLLEPARCVT
jgi:hypothetical protein